MKTCTALLALLATGISFSQQKDSVKTKTPRFILKMTHGMTTSSEFDFTNSEWQRMTPGFDVPDSLKQSSYGGPNFNTDIHNIHTTSSNIYYMFSFSFINGKGKQTGRKFQSTTSIHLGYGPEIKSIKHWYHESRQAFDTLISTQTGQAFYVFGNRNQTISKSYRSRTIVFGAGQHFGTNPSRIFQFETGVDVLCLVSIASDVRASYVDNYTIDGTSQPYQSYPAPVLNEAKGEVFYGNLTAGLIMRIPLEMSFELSKKNPVLSRMRIGGELNPGLATHFTKGLVSSNFNISGGMNFRFAI